MEIIAVGTNEIFAIGKSLLLIPFCSIAIRVL